MLAALVAAVVCSVLVTAPRAGAASPRGAPAGFAPAATAWTSPHLGWVLGFAPCDSRSCPVLLRTADGGRSWWRTGAPDLAAPTTDRARIAFADRMVGVITDGVRLHVTRDGGRTWRQAVVDGAAPPVRVVALAAEHDRLHAVVVGSSATRLHVASPTTGRFTAVPGVEVPGTADGEVAPGGGRTHVVLAAVHRTNRYWVGSGDRWKREEPPCSTTAATELAAGRGPSVFALCGQDPGMGGATKLLRVSDAGGPFRSLGQAPREGITTGFAAVSPTEVAVAAVGRGAGWLHLGVEHGTRWSSPLVVDGPPLFDLQFTGSGRGALVRGGHGWSVAQVLVTSDGGRTWAPVEFSG